MERWVRVTSADYSHEEPIYVNMHHVMVIRPRLPSGSELVLAGGAGVEGREMRPVLKVTQTPAEIYKMDGVAKVGSAKAS